jgi:hypothetical protein
VGKTSLAESLYALSPNKWQIKKVELLPSPTYNVFRYINTTPFSYIEGLHLYLFFGKYAKLHHVFIGGVK